MSSTHGMVVSTFAFWLEDHGFESWPKVCTILVWYYIEGANQENESGFVYKRRIARLDWNYKEWYQTRTFAFHGWTIKDVDLSRKIKSNLFIRRSFCRIVELSSSSGSKSIENPKSDLLKQWKTLQFDIWRILIWSHYCRQKNQNKWGRNFYKKIEVDYFLLTL